MKYLIKWYILNLNKNIKDFIKKFNLVKYVHKTLTIL